MPPPPAEVGTVPVVCGIIEHNNKFLAAQRGTGQSNAGFWEFPGGKVHCGETAEAALLRELKEELAIEVSITVPLASHTYTYPWITINLIPFVCSLTSGEPHPREHAGVKWIDSSDARTLPWTPADVPVLKEYLDSKKFSL
jgi:8-oxo-dGTP diphosphatase